MALRDINLSTRITAAALALVTLGAFGLMFIEDAWLRNTFIGEQRIILEEAGRIEEQRLTQAIGMQRRDALFLADTPPISGILRATRNKGYDARYRNTTVVWQERLQQIFTAFSNAHPEYYQLRYIGLADGGRELVRIDRNGERVEITPPERLQQKGDRGYFKAGLKLRPGETDISGFDCNQENGKVEHPCRLTVRAVAPVFDEDGKQFGMLVINRAAGGVLKSAALGLPRGVGVYIADADGAYLLRSGAQGVEVPPEPGSKGEMLRDFPTLEPMFGTQMAVNLPLHEATAQGVRGYLAARRVVFDAGDPQGFLLLAYRLPAAAIAQQAARIPAQHVAGGLLALLLVGGMVLLVLRRTFAPLKQLAKAADDISAGNYNFGLPENAKGEIGHLVQAIDTMLDRLLRREQEVLQLNVNLEEKVAHRTAELHLANERLEEEIVTRRQIEELVQHENEFRRELIESLPGVFYMLDANGRLLMWNRNLTEVLHVGEGELAGACALDFIGEGDKAKVLDAIHRAFETDGDVSLEAELAPKDGARIPYQLSGRCVTRDGGKVLIGTGLDISMQRERMRVTNALLRRNQALMQNSMEGIHVLDIDGNVIEANDAFCNMLGYTREEVMRLSVADWDAHFSKEELHAAFKGLIGHSAMIETVHRRKDGNLINVEICVCGIEIDGAAYLFASIRDITERKKVQEVMQRHHLVLETAMDGFWLTDLEGVLEETNEAYAKMSGYAVQELVGMRISDLEAKEKPEDTRAHIEKIAVQGYDRFETRHRRRDGSVMDIEVSVTLMPEHGKLFVFSRDITERKRAEETIKNTLLFQQRLMDAIPSPIFYKDAAGAYIGANKAFEQYIGLQPEQFIGKTVYDIAPADLAEKYDKADKELLSNPCTQSYEAAVVYADGTRHDVLFNKATFVDYEGRVAGLIGVILDITERKQVEQALRVAAATFETHDAILITDAQSNIIRVNRAFTEVTGYRPEEVLGKNPRFMSSGRHDRAFFVEMWQQLTHAGSWAGEVWDRRKNGEIYPKWLTITAVRDGHDEATQYVAIFSDITERKQAEEEIRSLAFYDSLTHLPNRRLFLERLRAALPASARHRDYGALMFLDMDKFKTLNDTLGHDYGDLMLIEVAQRIKSCVREMDTVARLGGDEFTVLIEGMGDDGQEASRKVATVAEKIRATLAQPYRLKKQEYRSSPSIGITLFHGSQDPVDMLLKHADLAMYQAKSGGRNTVRFFDPVMQDDTERHDTLVEDLRHAIERGELRLYYQVQVDGEQHPVGAEALLRWEHPVRGLVMPDQFIPVAEESALIAGIDRWVLDEACAQLARWRGDEHMRGLTLVVNVSVSLFAEPDFVEQVAAVVARHDITPALLKLELTESVVLGDLNGAVEKVRELRAIGVSLSMDDFDTIYSSLYYLKQLVSDQIKIHREVVQGITGGEDDTHLVQAIVELAKNMELDVYAEGVETEEQLAFLKQHGCMAYQGYLFGKPLPLGEFEKLLKGM